MPRLKLYFEFVLECDIDNLYWNVTLIICRLYICDMKYVQGSLVSYICDMKYVQGSLVSYICIMKYVQGSLVSYICAEIHVKYIEYFQCFLTCA